MVCLSINFEKDINQELFFKFSVAWSVARTSNQGSGNVEYPLILVNEGDVWQTLSHRAVIPREGYYFIHICAGLHLNEEIWRFLFVNVNNEGRFIILQNQDDPRIDTVGRSGILYLSVRDVVHVTSGVSLYSDNQMQTMFIGFLL